MNSHHKKWTISSRIQSPDSPSPTKHEIIIGRRQCAGRDQQLQTNGQVWLQVLQLDLNNSPLLHPAMGGEMRSMINYLVGAFPGIMDWSFEMWEEYLRKETNPGAEIDHWMAVDKAFVSFAGGKPLECQMEVFRLLMLHCTPLASDFGTNSWNPVLTDVELDAILDYYYAHYTEG